MFQSIPFRKHLSDSDLVEKTRKNLKWFKRVAWVHLSVVVALAFLLPKFFRMIMQMIDTMPNDSRKWAWMGLLFGVVMGSVFAAYIFKAIESIIMGFDLLGANRKDKLLIRYHDYLKQIAEQKKCEPGAEGDAVTRAP